MLSEQVYWTNEKLKQLAQQDFLGQSEIKQLNNETKQPRTDPSVVASRAKRRWLVGGVEVVDGVDAAGLDDRSALSRRVHSGCLVRDGEVRSGGLIDDELGRHRLRACHPRLFPLLLCSTDSNSAKQNKCGADNYIRCCLGDLAENPLQKKWKNGAAECRTPVLSLPTKKAAKNGVQLQFEAWLATIKKSAWLRFRLASRGQSSNWETGANWQLRLDFASMLN